MRLVRAWEWHRSVPLLCLSKAARVKNRRDWLHMGGAEQATEEEQQAAGVRWVKVRATQCNISQRHPGSVAPPAPRTQAAPWHLHG